MQIFFKILLLIFYFQGQNFYASESPEDGFRRETTEVEAVLFEQMGHLKTRIPAFHPQLTDNIITILSSVDEIPIDSKWKSKSFEPLAENFLVTVRASLIQAEVNCRKSSGQYSLLGSLNSVRMFSVNLGALTEGEKLTDPSAIS